MKSNRTSLWAAVWVLAAGWLLTGGPLLPRSLNSN